MRELLHTDRVILVEGQYDVARLTAITDAAILRTDGFTVYTDKARQKLLKQLARTNGLVILTDSDAAGFKIRNYVTNLVGAQHVLQAYIPALPGKEKRKSAPGKEGLLGVEGVDTDTLYGILQNLLAQDSPDTAPLPVRPITYTDLYEWGLSGSEGAQQRKADLLKQLDLPPRLSKKELVQVLNRLFTWDQLDALIRETEI